MLDLNLSFVNPQLKKYKFFLKMPNFWAAGIPENQPILGNQRNKLII